LAKTLPYNSMEQFIFYLRQGVEHITDPEGLDHMIFIITLCAVYTTNSKWRQLLILVTAFTLGHSATLALAALKIIPINQQFVETLIPITILLTSIYNITRKNNSSSGRFQMNYFLALAFGLIHGMGFSNFFSAMMMGISDNSIILPLFSFNLGIEMGQLCIVSVFVLLAYLFNTFLRVKHHDWNLYISGAGGGVAITMIVKALL